MKIKIKNNLTKEEFIIVPTNVSDSSALFYDMDIELPANIQDGEYEYELFKDKDKDENKEILAVGLLQIGDYVPEKKEYKSEQKYKVYGE